MHISSTLFESVALLEGLKEVCLRRVWFEFVLERADNTTVKRQAHMEMAGKSSA
jgi:hypothetical protein